MPEHQEGRKGAFPTGYVLTRELPLVECASPIATVIGQHACAPGNFISTSH